MLNFTRQEKMVMLFLITAFVVGGGIHLGKNYLKSEINFAIEDTSRYAIEFKNKKLEVDSLYLNKIHENKNKDGIKININTADQKELCKIKGIGPVTAEKILKYRNQNGKFLQIEDLENVKGIGKKTIKKIKGEVTVD